MESFTITCRVIKKEYMKILYARIFRSPGFIIPMILGAYFMLTAIADILQHEEVRMEDRIWPLLGGWALLIFPVAMTSVASKRFDANKALQHDATYAFSEEGVKVVTATYKADYIWAHLVKRKEQGPYLMLFHTTNTANFIDKTKLTPEQLEFIRSKVPEGNQVGVPGV